MSDFSRRKFLKTGAAALAGITIAPSSILGMSHGHVSPTDKLNLAAVGIGGMGHANINNVKGTEKRRPHFQTLSCGQEVQRLPQDVRRNGQIH